MGDFAFERGDLDSIMLTVLRLSGTVPNFPADYAIPKVRISHITGVSEVEDLAFTNMSQMGSSNRWFYNHTVPLSAPFTRFLVTFEAVIEGVTTQATEEFLVKPPVTVTGSGGDGAFPVTLTLINSVSLLPISDATINVYDGSNPSALLATVQTDVNGVGTVFLDPGNYIVEFKKSGVISEVHNLSVDSLGDHELDGN